MNRRPLPLSAVLGQDAGVRALVALCRRDQPAPPLLLHGPEGVGKRTAALAFAAALVCRQPQGADACGVCPACHRVADGGAVTELRADSTGQDSPIVYPDVGLVSVAPRKTRITILQVRDIVLSMSVQPYEVSRRIYVVDPADRMNTAAANALLKVLEEPPSYGVLVLVTTSPWSLPMTVRSRLHAIRFRPLAPDVIETLLVAHGLAPADAAARSREAGGSVARALAGRSDAERGLVGTWVEILDRLGRGVRPAALAAAAGEDLASDAESAVAALEALLAVLRDLAAAPSGSAPAVLEPAQAARLESHAELFLGPALDRPALVDRLRREITEFNRNPRLAVEGAVLALAGMLRDRDLPR